MAVYPSRFDLKLWKNSQYDFQVALENDDGTPVDLTGCSAILRVFEPQVALFSITGVITALAGTIDLTIPAPTLDVTWTLAQHEVAVTFPNGARYVYLYGDVTIGQP